MEVRLTLVGALFSLLHLRSGVVAAGTMPYIPDRLYIISTVFLEPYFMQKKGATNSTSNDRYEGFIPDLISRLSKIVGFRYRFIPTRDGQYGIRRLDGTWNGMIGDILRREAYMAAAPIYITEQRAKVVDFTAPFLNVQATIVIRKPEEGTPLPFSTARDLIYQSAYTYGTLNRGVIRRSLSMSNNSIYSTMWKQIRFFEPSALTLSNAEGLQRVREEKFAFIMPNVIADYVSRRKPCDLLTIDSFLMKKGYAIAVRKGSGLLPHLNSAMNALKSKGYLERLYYKWWIHNGECSGNKHSKRYFVTTSRGARMEVNGPITLWLNSVGACFIGVLLTAKL